MKLDKEKRERQGLGRSAETELMSESCISCSEASESCMSCSSLFRVVVASEYQVAASDRVVTRKGEADS